ncbi:MAG: hypothetical protein LBD41_05100 [Clostridiales Family XIII bacterium]|jgi:Ca2+/H+ antiporter|nr:hypothetical protein [Clostridiales Family XIII bacterium]
MTLLLTLGAAIIAGGIRFFKPEFAIRNYIGFLALMYFGAALMWCIDGVASLIGGEAFIDLVDKAVVIDDLKLGLSVIVLGLFVWFVFRLIARKSAKKA